MDSDNNGFLTKEEIEDSIASKIGSTQTDFDEILRAADSNNDGKVSYNEFITAAADRTAVVQKKNLDKAFKMFDADNNGFITIDELKAAFANESNSASGNANWLEFIKAADKNGDH